MSDAHRVSVICRCLAPVASAVMKGRLTSVWLTLDSSHLAFSAASRRRCTASLSPDRSMPCGGGSVDEGGSVERCKSGGGNTAQRDDDFKMRVWGLPPQRSALHSAAH